MGLVPRRPLGLGMMGRSDDVVWWGIGRREERCSGVYELSRCCEEIEAKGIH